MFIVESPSPQNILDNVFEGKALTENLRLIQGASDYFVTINEAMLKQAFESITTKIKKNVSQKSPKAAFLHLSAHGSDKGIVLASGEVILWNKLRKLLIPLNTAAKGTLILCMSTCKGFNAFTMARTLSDLPYSLIIGSNESIEWRDAIIAFSTFYHLSGNRSQTFQEAVAGMNVSIAAKKGMGFTHIQSKDAQIAYENDIIDLLSVFMQKKIS